MRFTVTLISLVAATSPALADAGHWAEVAGHDHWLAAAALAAALAAAAWAVLKGEKSEETAEKAESDPEAEAAGQES